MGRHLLSAGAKGKRYLTPHARVLMHQPSGGAGGSAMISSTVCPVLAAVISASSYRDHWFSAQEALEYGFVDHIVRSSREIGKQNGDN